MGECSFLFSLQAFKQLLNTEKQPWLFTSGVSECSVMCRGEVPSLDCFLWFFFGFFLVFLPHHRRENAQDTCRKTSEVLFPFVHSSVGLHVRFLLK
jgi:hypothetical protein